MKQTIAESHADRTNVSLIIDSRKKALLEQLAKKQNYSLEFFIAELIDRALQDFCQETEMDIQEQTEYEMYVQKRVMYAYESVLSGQRGDALATALERVRAKAKDYAQDKN